MSKTVAIGVAATAVVLIIAGIAAAFFFSQSKNKKRKHHRAKDCEWSFLGCRGFAQRLELSFRLTSLPRCLTADSSDDGDSNGSDTETGSSGGSSEEDGKRR